MTKYVNCRISSASTIYMYKFYIKIEHLLLKFEFKEKPI